MENKHRPCLKKNCAWCCNPVKIAYSKRNGFCGNDLKKALNHRDIWKETGEIFVSENHPETIQVKTFRCDNFDEENNKCKDYENRPDICRNTTCLKNESCESEDEQRKKFINEKFLKIR